MRTTLWIAGLTTGLLAVYVIVLVFARNRLRESLALCHVLLKQRYDLLPNLAQTTQRYLGHERGLLTEVSALRSFARRSGRWGQRFDRRMYRVTNLFRVTVENYPQLHGVEPVAVLLHSLQECEHQLAAARRAYLSSARRYNNLVEFPLLMRIATRFGHRPAPYCDLDPLEQRPPPVGQHLWKDRMLPRESARLSLPPPRPPQRRRFVRTRQSLARRR